METSPLQAVKFQQIEVKTPQLIRPAMSAPQLVSRSMTELTVMWNPWIPKQNDELLDSSSVEYALEWQQGSGQDGVWSTVPGILKACEATRKNLRPSTLYCFRVRARLVCSAFFCTMRVNVILLVSQANGPWSQYGDITSIMTKDADVKTGIGMRVTEKGHVVSHVCFTV